MAGASHLSSSNPEEQKMRPIPPPPQGLNKTNNNSTNVNQSRPPPVPATLGNRLKSNNVGTTGSVVGSTTNTTTTTNNPSSSQQPQQRQGDHFTDHEKEILKKASKAWSTYQRPTFQGIGEEGRSDIQNTISGFRAYEFLLRQEEGNFHFAISY